MKKTRAPLAENLIKELDIVMLLVADELDPAMNPEEILLVIETEIIPVVNIRMTAAIVSRLEIVMTPADQRVTVLTADLIGHAPQEESARRSIGDPEAKLAGGP